MRRFLFLLALLILGLNAPASVPTQFKPLPEEVSTFSRKISFTLHNKSQRSIPLFIPGVMNPNLSPNSDSKVTLSIGQKILYKFKGKRRVLLMVDESLAGQELDVVKLIQQKKMAWSKKR